ncbi:MAG TPA: helix-turn-helix transcriptional regulator [Roseiarcus sp.]|nr:helix-turn-helix transcriptional regulator [Roseiarcus sp.]
MKKAPNPIDKHVGARLRMRRVLVGMSQEKLGDALNITFQQIQKYEKGANRIGASRLQQLARVLDVPPAFFFEGAPSSEPTQGGFSERQSSSYVVDFLSTAEGLQLNRSFALIRDPKVRKRILDLVASLAQDPNEDPPPNANDPS